MLKLEVGKYYIDEAEQLRKIKYYYKHLDFPFADEQGAYYKQDGESVGYRNLLHEVTITKVEPPKPVLNITEKDVGKAAKFRDHRLSLILGWDPSDCRPVQTVRGRNYSTGEHLSTKEECVCDIVEILD